MLDFLKFKESFSSLTIGIAGVLIGLNGEWLDGSAITDWVRTVTILAGLAIMVAGFTLTLRWALTKPGANDDPDKFRADYTRGAQILAGLMSIAAVGLLVFVVGAAAWEAIFDDDDVDARAEFAKSFATYFDALDDDDSDELFRAQMDVFAKCKPEIEEDDGAKSKEEPPNAQTQYMHEVCSQLLNDEGEMDRDEAATILAQLTQPTPAATEEPDSSVTPRSSRSR
jgi:hypothetical protein